MSVQHVWRSWRADTRAEKYNSWCGRVLYRCEGTPLASELEGATCMDCVVSVQRRALWRAKENASIAENSTRLLESLRLSIRKRKITAEKRRRADA